MPENFISEINLSNLISTIVGGAATIIAALLAFWLTHRSERNRREEEEKLNASRKAISGYLKLAQYANLISNIKNHIDRSYEESGKEGNQSSEAFLSVQPAAGLFHEPEAFKAEEISFLLSKDGYQVLEKIDLVEQRAKNLHHLFLKYSSVYMEFQNYLFSIPKFEREMDGKIAKDIIPKEHKGKLDYWGGQLNILLGGIVENLDEDLKLSIEAARDFNSIAYAKYYPHFPKIDLREGSVIDKILK